METLKWSDIDKPKEVHCNACPLVNECQTNRISPRGPSDADILLVMDRVYENEDKEGRIGGGINKLLWSYIKRLGLDKFSWRVTKAVRCYTENNIGVRIAEVCAREHLYKEIEKTKPKLVVIAGSLGAIAMTAKNQRVGIMTAAGTLIDSVYHKKVYAICPPGMIYQRPELKSKLLNDLKRIHDVMGKGIAKWSPKWELLDHPKAVVDALRGLTTQDEPIGFDYETGNTNLDTDGMSAFKDGACIGSMAFGTSKKAFTLPFPQHPDCPSRLKDIKIATQRLGIETTHVWNFDSDDQFWGLTGCYGLVGEMLQNPKVFKLAHNAAYETLWSRRYGIHLRGLLADTMLQHYMLDPDARGTHGLDNITIEYFPEAGRYWVGVYDKPPNALRVPGKKLFPYNAIDVLMTCKAFYKMQDLLEKKYGKVFDPAISMEYYTQMSVPMLARLQYNGWKTNGKRMRRLLPEFEQEEAKARAALVNLKDCRKAVKIVSGWQNKEVKEFNPGSPQHRQALYYDVLKLEPIRNRMTNEPDYTTEKKVVEKLFASQFDKLPEAIEKMFAWAQVNGMLTKYVRPIHDHHFVNGYVHASYKQHGTGTNRLASSDPNGQNIPERNPLAPKVKSMFVSRW